MSVTDDIKQKLIAARANVREIEDELRAASTVGWLAIIQVATKEVEYVRISNELPTPIDTFVLNGGAVRLGQDQRLWIQTGYGAPVVTMPFKNGRDKFNSFLVFHSDPSREQLEIVVAEELKHQE